MIAGCSTASNFQYPPVRWVRDTDRAPIKEPKVKEHKHEGGYDAYTQQAEEVLKFTQNMASMPREITFGGRTALNTNNFDEVADSTWFANRIGRYGTFVNEFTTPPDLKDKFEVLSTDNKDPPTEYVIKDSKGNDYLIKIDNSSDGLESSSEVLGTLFLHAVGYNVTENYIVRFNGKRALAIRMPKGKNLGHFLFNGKRKGDPNDRIPHEYRRELRSLRLFAAFLNNKEFGVNNNLDIYDSYITHYLTNYSTPLANMRSEFTSGAPKREQATVDALFSFGMYNPYWTASDKPEEKKGGIISSKDFIPAKWQPRNNNTAFKFMTQTDAFWAAKLLAKFTDGDIAALVAAAGYEDKSMADTVAKELIIRRDKIVSYYFDRLAPLDDFILQGEVGVLAFTDLASLAGTRYRYRIMTDKGTSYLLDWQETGDASIPIPSDIQAKMRIGRYHMIQLQMLRPNTQWWSASVDIYIKKDPELNLIGIKRRYSH